MSDHPLALTGKKGTLSFELASEPAPATTPSYADFIQPGGAEVDDPNDISGLLKILDPFDVTVDAAGLQAAQRSLIVTAQEVLGKPSEGKPAYVFGGEGAQHGGQTLPQLLINAGDAGFDVFQPSGKHIDLARCATDGEYAAWVLAVHKAAKIPLLSVSVHMDAYFLLSAVHDLRARAILSPPSQLGDSGIQLACQYRMALIIQGAARLGIQVLHLFWGQPGTVPPYGWPFHEDGGANVERMRQEFIKWVTPLIELAAKLGVYLCHEIHFGTIALNADDYITIWEKLGKPKHFAIGFDPSHFWHGEPWWIALDKLRRAGILVIVCHFKQTLLLAGRPMLGYEHDDRKRGMMFCSLSAPGGMVCMNAYAGQLTLPGTGLVEFWHGQCDLPIPGYAEAEDPHWNTWDVLAEGVGYLQSTIGRKRLPKAHFTAEMGK